MEYRIADLNRDTPELVEQAAVLLHDAFHNRTDDWQELETAREEVMESLAPGRISRVALDAADTVLGWSGAIPGYRGRVWELHPLVVAKSHRRRGIGRALVEDLERLLAGRGAATLWLGSDDEHNETNLGGMNLYDDVAGAIRGFRTIEGEHPGGFYLRLGFRVVGVMPDANGSGKPDIFFAK